MQAGSRGEIVAAPGNFGTPKNLSVPTGTVQTMGFMDRLRKHEATPEQRPPAVRLNEPRFVVIDVETTGLSPQLDRILEVAVVTTDPWGRVLGEWSTRINPEGPVGATHIHGISETDVSTSGSASYGSSRSAK